MVGARLNYYIKCQCIICLYILIVILNKKGIEKQGSRQNETISGRRRSINKTGMNKSHRLVVASSN